VHRLPSGAGDWIDDEFFDARDSERRAGIEPATGADDTGNGIGKGVAVGRKAGEVESIAWNVGATRFGL